MRIEAPPFVVDIKGAQALKPASPAAVREPDGAARRESQERVVISPRMREVEQLREQLAALPEVRTDMVALARQQMQYGPYRVDPAEVARKLVDSQLRG